jgi:hypothetical protein
MKSGRSKPTGRSAWFKRWIDRVVETRRLSQRRLNASFNARPRASQITPLLIKAKLKAVRTFHRGRVGAAGFANASFEFASTETDKRASLRP